MTLKTIQLSVLASIFLVGCPKPVVDNDGDGSSADEDCNDEDATIYPGAPEIWDDGIDQDCDGVADVEGAECAADFTLSFPDGSTTTLNGCSDWDFNASFEFDPDDPPEVIDFTFSLGATTEEDFDCRIELVQQGICGEGYYDQRLETGTTTLVLMDCSGVADEYEGSFDGSEGYLRIDTIEAGTESGSFVGEPLPTTLVGHLHVWTEDGIDLEGDVSLTLTQVAGDGEEQLDCVVTDGDEDGDGYVAENYDGNDCLDQDESIYPLDYDEDGTSDVCGYYSLNSGGEHTCLLNQYGEIECWSNDVKEYDLPVDSVYQLVDVGNWAYSCAITSSGEIDCWGLDLDYGVLSDAPSGSDYMALSAGEYHVCALDSSGNIECWGLDHYGQISNLPKASGYTAITVGDFHSCALDSAGAIDCWGLDNFGQLTDAPKESGHTALTSGQEHSCALSSSGKITCWGSNEAGQLEGTPTTTGYIAVSAGWRHTCSLNSDGGIECWGFDQYSQVSGAPDGTGYTSVGEGGEHTCALISPNIIDCWGRKPGTSKPWSSVF